jgi:Tfp pilus assembly protein PilO
MTRIILPIILLAGALGLFIMYTNPTFQSIKQLSAKQASYNDALDKAQQLLAIRNNLLSTRASFSEADVTKLAHMLPNNVDNIRFIIDINTIASRHRAALAQVQLGDTLNTSKGEGSALSSGSANTAVGSVEIGFSVTASYDDFLAFEQDLEHSLRIIDVSKIAFTSGAQDSNTYSFTIKTYWLH